MFKFRINLFRQENRPFFTLMQEKIARKSIFFCLRGFAGFAKTLQCCYFNRDGAGSKSCKIGVFYGKSAAFAVDDRSTLRNGFL